MVPFETGSLTVPDAKIYYEVRGSGPLLLLIPGGNSDAAVFEGLATVLAAQFRVVSYDPRGYSRSVLLGPPVDQCIEVLADDAYRLLRHVALEDEAAYVFGSCSGGLVALELALRHPGVVRSVLAHEPPALCLLPDAAQYRELTDAVHQAFRKEGVAAAMRRLSVLFGGRAAPDLPEAHDNTAFFLAHMLRPSTRFMPDLPALAAMAERIGVAEGLDSRTQIVHRPVVVLAERLGKRLAEFPGGHVGYVKWPVEFAGRLVDVFAAMPGTRHSGSPYATEEASQEATAAAIGWPVSSSMKPN